MPFQSTHPARGATSDGAEVLRSMQQFQYTHPARGATGLAAVVNPDGSYFNPRTPRGVRLTHSFSSDGSSGFQSKHPARGATCSYCKHGPINGDFNPRTPRGVRHAIWLRGVPHQGISIHAPREGCDARRLLLVPALSRFQSTHPARGATANFTKEQRVCLAQFAYLHKGKKAEHTKTNAPMLH